MVSARAARAAPDSAWRNFYVWSDTPDRYKEARIIFKDVETSNWTWDQVAGAYYWHRFFSHQPDLNYENPEVHEAMTRVVDFWLDLGVDGLRLDAVPYLYEQEGTNCENLPPTHAFLKKLRAHVDEKYQDRMLLAEANQWPEDAVAYFGQGRGDECHMAFHFPLMPRLFMAVRMEDRTPIVDILEQTPPIPETSQWALFLRNHDELTLEMVTDEERDYMYRMYAHVHQARLNLGIRRRLAPLLGNDRKRIELLNGLLLSLPGTPVLYYGDEIGMGDNIYLGDRNGVRTPMQWSADRNAGFSRANPQRLYLPITLDPEYHYEAVNVEAQLRNPHSLLWWMRRVLALRKTLARAGRGARRVPGAAEPQGAGLHPAATSRRSCWWWPTCRAFPSRSSSTSRPSKAACPSSCLAARPSRPSASCRSFSRPGRTASIGFRWNRRPPPSAARGNGLPSAGDHADRRAALGRSALGAVDAGLGKGAYGAPAGRESGSPLGGKAIKAPRCRMRWLCRWGRRKRLSDALAGGICRSRSGMVCGAAGLRHGRRGRALAPRGTPARGRRGEPDGVRSTGRALRCARDAGVRQRVAGGHRPAATPQGAPGQRGFLARAAVARAFARSGYGLEERATQDGTAAHFGPIRRAVRLEALPPAALGH